MAQTQLEALWAIMTRDTIICTVLRTGQTPPPAQPAEASTDDSHVGGLKHGYDSAKSPQPPNHGPTASTPKSCIIPSTQAGSKHRRMYSVKQALASVCLDCASRWRTRKEGRPGLQASRMVRWGTKTTAWVIPQRPTKSS